jgi:hypothetical protein
MENQEHWRADLTKLATDIQSKLAFVIDELDTAKVLEKHASVKRELMAAKTGLRSLLGILQVKPDEYASHGLLK